MNDILENYTVTIPVRKFQELMDDSSTLYKLRAAGVDNWEGYEDALFEDEEEEDG